MSDPILPIEPAPVFKPAVLEYEFASLPIVKISVDTLLSRKPDLLATEPSTFQAATANIHFGDTIQRCGLTYGEDVFLTVQDHPSKPDKLLIRLSFNDAEKAMMFKLAHVRGDA